MTLHCTSSYFCIHIALQKQVNHRMTVLRLYLVIKECKLLL